MELKVTGQVRVYVHCLHSHGFLALQHVFLCPLL